jgi:hypothetical protein
MGPAPPAKRAGTEPFSYGNSEAYRQGRRAPGKPRAPARISTLRPRLGATIAFDYNRAMNPAMPLDYLVSALVTLLVVVDPVGLTPTFLAVT